MSQTIQKAFDNAPTELTGNVRKAITWAKQTLRDYEGKGHQLYVHREQDGQYTCSFAKPEWSGDHCSRKMPTGAEAVVMAVCEYMNGG